MIHDIGDILKNHLGRPYLIVGVCRSGDTGYLFELYDLQTCSTTKWYEPWGQELPSSYWTFLG